MKKAEALETAADLHFIILPSAFVSAFCILPSSFALWSLIAAYWRLTKTPPPLPSSAPVP
jgi:hypothetical protein